MGGGRWVVVGGCSLVPSHEEKRSGEPSQISWGSTRFQCKLATIKTFYMWVVVGGWRMGEVCGWVIGR